MSISHIGKVLIILFITSYGLILSQNSFAFENLFYTLRGTDLQHLQKHLAVLQEIQQQHNKINIIVSQAYYINQYGTVAGNIDPNLLKIAKLYHIKVMPLLTRAWSKMALFSAIHNFFLKILKKINFSCRFYRLISTLAFFS